MSTEHKSDVMEREGRFFFMVFLPKTHGEKKIRQTQIEGHSTKYLTRTPFKTATVMKNKESLKKLSEMKETN